MPRVPWDETNPESIDPSRLNGNDDFCAYESTIGRTSVRLATTTALPANTRAGAVLTMNSNGALAAIDTGTPALNDVILVKNEATPENNGRHFVSQVGDSTHPATLTRCADADTDAETPVGMLMYVWDGSANKGKFFFLDLSAGSVTVNSTGQVYTQLPVDASLVHLAGAETITGNKSLADGVNVPLGTSTGSQIGTATAQKLAFHGATAVVQRAGAAQVAVATTPSTNSSPYGYAQAQADALIALVNEMRATLVEKGIMKGSA